MGDAATVTPRGQLDQRSRIVDVALELMSRHGFAGTSMRQLARACAINVATLYHYFPSKADLLQAVIAERRYSERMTGDMPPIDPGLPPRERFAAFFYWVWDETAPEEPILRLLVGEGLHGEEAARRSAHGLVVAVDRWLGAMLDKLFPELDRDRVPTPVAARLIRGQLLGLVVQHLAIGEADSHRTADELAVALFPSE